MNIHVVQPGDTIYTIASSYGVDPERLSIDNDITDPNNLILGEALAVFKPKQTYIVQEGDNLESIANTQGTDVMELLRNNPNISGRELYIGETLVISYVGIKAAKIKTNGFAYPFINIEILRKTLPYLTYLTIYTYEYKENGSIGDVIDSEAIQLAKDYGVVPIMFLAAANDEYNNNEEIAHILINDMKIQNKFIDNILKVLQNKGYSGVNMETPFVKPGDRKAYVNLITKITERLNSEGYSVMVTIEPSTFEVSTGIIYSGVDYEGLGNAANDVLYQLTYAWRYPSSLPISVLHFDAVMETLAKAVTRIPSDKCILGISDIGYLWEFPYFSAITIVNFLNNNAALELARDTDSIIQFNEPTRTTYFRYIDNEREYMAWFKDIRVIYPMLVYSQGYGMQGISIWSIMHFNTNTWLMINAQYEIEKLV
jgi:spore germination protein